MSDETPKVTTLHGGDPEEVRRRQATETGMHSDYVVLSQEERAKGLVRPVRTAYTHAGREVCGWITSPLSGNGPTDTADVCAEPSGHDGEHGEVTQKATRAQLERMSALLQAGKPAVIGGCGHITTMGTALAETYARQPDFYGATFCVNCNAHFPVGAVGEFTWVDDGTRVGT